MIAAKTRPDRHLVQPFSLEDRQVYLTRFLRHPEMIEIFGDRRHRRQMAVDLFDARWKQACATVVRRDGTRFFID